jgi:hypothetical protein
MNYRELFVKSSKRWLKVIAAALVLLLASCGTQGNPTTSAPDAGPSSVLLEQLGAVKQNLSSSKLPLRMVEMKLSGTLESNAQVDELRQRLVAGQALVPQYDGLHAESFALSTVEQRMTDFQLDSQNNQNVVANIETAVFPLIKAGQRTVDLTWESGGKQFHTTGVYDEQGIVYDNVLSNIVLVEEEQPSKLEDTLEPGTESTLQAQATAYTARALDLTIKWVWGGKRGKITVDHTIIWNGSNYIYDQSGSAHHYMTLGKTDAKTKNTVMSHRRYAKIAYGYAWATPTASFSISFDAKRGDVGGSFKVSLSGVGSKGGGDAHHTIYLR